MVIKPLYFAVFLLVIFVFGYWVSRAGKPYSVALLTVHKLTGVAVGITLVVMAVRVHNETALTGGQISTLAVTVFLFLVLVAAGGLISTEKEMPGIVIQAHKYLPYLAAILTAITIILLL